jgi:hypothetical protein
LSPSGTFETFDDPNASGGTYPCCINDAGTIVGYYNGSSSAGFVRSASGTFSTLSVPGASGTLPFSINATGDIAGYYLDDAFVGHGFIRSAAGPFATFEVLGAGSGAGEGTVAKGINDAGTVTGFYLDSASVYHGFILEQ